MTVRPDAEPWSADGNSVGVLVLHGFTGSPKSMIPWGKVLADQGWTVRVPRLPGHGTTWQEMNQTTWEDWYGEAERSLRELTERCDHVFVTGLSMGGSLSLRLAELHGDEITGIVLVNPAVHTENKMALLLPVLHHVLPGYPGISNDIKKPGQDEGAYTKVPVKAMHSLTQGWKLIKDDLGRVTCPLLLFRSLQDSVLEPSNAEYILTHVGSSDAQEILLPDSAHVATLDFDAEVIHRDSIAFINRLTS